MSNIDDCISCIQSNLISIKIDSCLYKEQNIKAGLLARMKNATVFNGILNPGFHLVVTVVAKSSSNSVM